MAMMGGGMGLRTIWISLRAMNYTGRVFGDVIKDVFKLIGSQNKLGDEIGKLTQKTVQYVAAGMMWATLAQMTAQSLLNMAFATKVGAQEMASLRQSMDEAKSAIADTVFELLKATGILDMLRGFLDELKRNKGLQILIVLLLGAVTAITALIGVGLLMRGLMNTISIASMLLGYRIQFVNGCLMVTKDTAIVSATAFRTLSIAIGLCLASFTLFMLLGQIIGKNAGIIVAAVVAITLALLALAVAMDIVSLGTLTGAQLGALAAGAGMAAGVMALGQGGFQSGTRGLPKTGLFYGHKGEVIYNPSSGRPTQTGNELGGRTPISTHYDTEIKIENVHTKADYDDLDEEIRKSLRKMMRERR